MTAAPFHIGSVTETEAFAGRLLQDDSGRSLQRVHQGWIIDRKNNDAFVGNVLDRFEDFPTFRIVGGIVADKHERTVDLLSRFSEGLNHTHRVLPTIEPGNLRHQWTSCRNFVVA
jgi:hypothetical protein